MADGTTRLRCGEQEYRVSVAADGSVSVDGGTPVAVHVGGAGEVRVGSPQPARAWVASTGDKRWVFLDGDVFEFELQPDGRRPARGAARGSLAAPMPASVVRVEAAPGDRVRRGDSLVILEAMKMELPVRAPSDGIVKAVHCKPGDLVTPGVPLIELE
jgi:biotin carboxyl carrier protein